MPRASSYRKHPEKYRAESKAYREEKAKLTKQVEQQPDPPQTQQLEIAPPIVPQFISIDISEKTYRGIIKNKVSDQPPWARPFLNQFFDFIKGLNPNDVATALASKKSLKDLYSESPFTTRLTVGSVRAYLKVNPGMRKQLREGVSPFIIKYVLKFDNPQVNELFMRMPEGNQVLDTWVRDSMEIIGASENG